jgi:fatty-acyl-CoA synthase
MATKPQYEAKAARQSWLRALEMTAPIGGNASLTFPVLIENLASRFGDAPALLSERECWTYRDLAERANRYARWALGNGITGGDTICLLMPNRPDYLAIWLGFTRIGGVVALVNTNLQGDALARSIYSVAAKHVIVDATLAGAVAAVLPQLAAGIRCWAHGQGQHDFPHLDRDVDRTAGDRLLDSECAPPSLMDRALYIYTSGTTGLPKAANVSHLRLMQWSHWFAGMMETGPSDRIYNCLPMYHSIGGIVAIGAALVGGGSVVLRPRFSASDFWDDVVATDCTLFQYIGELCRYLVNSPPHPQETRHRIRLCCGNGLSADIWERFERRFRIPRIIEFYAATEGTVSLYNCEGKAGAIGRIPSFLAHRFPLALVKFDFATGAPARDAEGGCIRCATNEVGEAIGKIADDGSGAGSRFEGYTDKEASDHKLLHDVFASGDTWFRTGDLMRRDDGGYFYFVDRIGDTFRWKGENVSTSEIAATISACPGIVEAVVYGVSVPAAEGRAGMAAIVVGAAFDLAACWRYLAERLPDYARPLFLRIRAETETTATLRPRKQDLAREGFDPAALFDPIYFNDRNREAFVALDAALYRRIVSGDERLF